jgi:hypothetical protein
LLRITPWHRSDNTEYQSGLAVKQIFGAGGVPGRTFEVSENPG